MSKVAVILCFIVLIGAETQAKETIRVAFVDAPPFSFLDHSNREKGLLVELFRDVSNELDLEPQFIYVPHKRQLEFINEGKVDMWAGQKNSRVAGEIAHTSDLPLFSMELRVYWNSGSVNINKLEDLWGKNLILISSYSYGGRYEQFRDKSSRAIYAINHENGFEKLYANKDSYLLGYTTIADKVFEKYGVKDFHSLPLSVHPLHLKLSRKFPDSDARISQINAYLESLRQ